MWFSYLQNLWRWVYAQCTRTGFENRLGAIRTSRACATRQPNQIRALAPLFGRPGMTWLAGGFPNSKFFPLTGLSFTLKCGPEAKKTETVQLDATALEKAQQYMLDDKGAGYAPLRKWIVDHMEEHHKPPYADWKCMITAGNSDEPVRLFHELLDPGDTLLMEEYAFAHSFSQLRPWMDARNVNVESLPVQKNGQLDVMHLAHLLENWHLERPSRRFPKALFVIPVAQNPTGMSMDPTVLRTTYLLCSKYDLTILEDDPYRLLYFGNPEVEAEAPVPGLDTLPPSFLSVDTDGRVLRMDSFSKFISPGMRIGWVTGPARFLEHVHDVNLVSSLSQVILSHMLDAWGSSGFAKHVECVQREYRRRCLVAIKATREHTSAKFHIPRGGMFLWIDVGCNTRNLVQRMADAGVAIVPGGMFQAVYDTSQSTFLRVSFCQASDEEINTGMQCIRHLVSQSK